MTEKAPPPRRHLPLIGAWARVLLLVPFWYAAWYQSADFTGVLTLTAIWAIAAVGLALVLGGAGQMMLCQASFVLLGAYAYAVPAREGLTPLLALVLAASAGGVAAALLTPVLRIRGYMLALATIAVALLIERAFKTGGWLPGGNGGLTGVPRLTVGGIDLTGPDTALWTALVVLSACMASAYRAFGRGATRRAIQLIHHDEGLLGAMGGNALALKRNLFIVSGLLGGLAGGLYGATYGFIRPGGFGITESFALALAVFIGGNGQLAGAVAGVLIYQFCYPLMSSDLAEYRFALLGVIVLLIMHFAPRGWLPRVRDLIGRRPSRTPPPSSAGGTTPAVEPSAQPGPAIRLAGLTKRYGALTAVDDLSATIPAGGLVALIGPNGAGKTTTLDLIAGEQRATAGQVWLGDLAVGDLPPDRRARLGLARTFQRIRLVPGLDVLENVMTGVDDAINGGRLARAAEGDRRALAAMALAEVGLGGRGAQHVAHLTFADRRLVEMARVLASRPRVVLLDEPSSGLNDAEAAGFADIVRGLHRGGCTIVLVEHNLPFVSSLADQVIALDQGRLLATGPASEVFESAAFVDAYVGVS